MKATNGKHDSLCAIVSERIWSHRDDAKGPSLKSVTMFKNIQIGKRRSEIDVYALKYSSFQNYVLKFEIKSSYKQRRKAVDQLNFSNGLFKGMRIYNFHVYYDENQNIIYERIKNK